MPPETLPWDRKKQHQQHDRSDGSLRSVARWRDSHHAYAPSAAHHHRWDDFGRPQGHGKQGGGGYQQHHQQQLFTEDSGGHGFMPSRAYDRMVVSGDDTNFRSSSSSRGRYGRSISRDFRGSFGHKGFLWESGDASTASARQQHDISAQRSVSDMLTYTSHPQSVIDNTSSWHHLQTKAPNDKMPTVDALGTGNRCDRDQSSILVDWKPLKWNRSSSLSSSRGSGFSHTSSSRSMGADSDETKPDLPSGRLTPQSPSGDAATACVASSAPFQDTCPRKKPRLGWGQGLAKYEKQKVEGSDETLTKSVLVPCSSLAKQSQSNTSMPDKSPIVAGIPECASPVTTSSVACSSSPGIDEISHMKAGNNDIDGYNLSSSPAHWFQSRLEEFSSSLEHLSGGTNLSCLLSDLLQQDDVCSGDSNIVKSTPMNKLLLVKSELSKALEKTECEIDMFENELKLLNSECKVNSPRSVASGSLQVEFALATCEDVATFSKFLKKPVPLQLVSSSDMHVDMPNSCNEADEQIHGEVKDDDIDSPGTATSKFVEPSSMEGPVSAYSMENHDNCSTGFVTARPAFSEKLWFLPANEEKSRSTSGGKVATQTESSVSAHAHRNPGLRLNEIILDSNRESARKACEVFNKLLPDNHSETDIWGSCSFASQKCNLLVKQKLASRKCFKKFKERILTLKYRALQHLWKEDTRLLSIRKYKVKSQKRIESNSRAPHIVYQKHRSSVRSRFTSAAGSLTLVPTSEIVEFTSKLLSDSKVMPYRDNLKMPCLVDEQEKRMLQFVSSNGLVEDPCATEKERAMINPWTPKEKAIFLERLGTIGKDFRKIAYYLDHKTTADCVEFYYKNHKSESFEKIKKKSELKKQERGFPTNTYLMTSGQKWNREVNAGSLVLLGEASAIAAHADESSKSQPTYSSRSFLGGEPYHRTCWEDDASYEKSSSGDVLCTDREATAADTLAGICGALSSEAMSSCVTSSVDPCESTQEGKFHKTSAMDQSTTPKPMESIDDEETCSDESCGEMDSVDWTDEEKSNFIGALRSYGKDFVKVARCVRSKSKDQCKVFFSKARKSLGLDVVHMENDREGSPLSDANGGRSDTEDAGVLEIESAICSTLSFKMDIAFNHLQTDKFDAGNKNGIEQLDHTHTDEPESSGEHNGAYLSNHDDGVTVGEGLILKKCQHEHETGLVLCDDYSSVKRGREKSVGPPEILQLDNASEIESSLIRDLPVMPNGDGVNHSTEGVKQVHTIIPVVENVGVEGQRAVNSVSIDTIEHTVTSADGLRTESSSMHCPEGGQDCNGNIKTGIDINNRSSSTCSDLDPNDSSNSNHQVAATSYKQSLSVSQMHQPHISLELLNSGHQAQTSSWNRKENCPTSVNSVLPGSHLLHYEDHLQQGSSPRLNFDGTRIENYSEPVLTKKDVNGHTDSINSEKQPTTPNSTVNVKYQPAQFSMQEFHRAGSNVPHLLPELPLLSKNHEQSSICHMRTNLKGSSDADEHSRRIGDVKLFGKILSHPSTSRPPNLSTSETDNQAASLRKSSGKPFDLKFTDQEKDRAFMASKLQSKYSGLDNFPARTYGYWDGSRIQTGLSSLPDSSTLLAKYPAAYSDYAATSSYGDQQSLPAVSKWNDRNSSSVSSSGSLPDYQVYRGYDSAKVPFTVDVTRHDPFSVQQKRNGLEVLSLQKQSRGLMGMNVMGPGVVVGGSCTGVSDPVAAIKMHYATTERYGMNGSLREGDSWGGDIGRQ